jgi:hypothetical protein
VDLRECLAQHLAVDIHGFGPGSRVPGKSYTWRQRFEQITGEPYSGFCERVKSEGTWDDAKRYAFTLGRFNGRRV